MPAKTTKARKLKDISRPNRKSTDAKSIKLQSRNNTKTKKNTRTKRITDTNFVTPLSTHRVDVERGSLEFSLDRFHSVTHEVDYIKFVKDIYPQVKELLYPFEQELSSKHSEPKEFVVWMLDCIKEYTESFITFNLNRTTNKYEAIVVDEVIEHSQEGGSAGLHWITELPDNYDTTMLKTAIKMLVEDCRIPHYWHQAGDEMELSYEIDSTIEALQNDLDEGFIDEEDKIYYEQIIKEYKVIAVELAQDIMSQEIDYYKVLEYSESESKYSKFVGLVWSLVKNNFRLHQHTNRAYNKHYGINLGDPYAVAEDYNSLAYRFSQLDEVCMRMQQYYSDNAGNYGIEPLVIQFPIEDLDKKKEALQNINNFREALGLLTKYSEQYDRNI